MTTEQKIEALLYWRGEPISLRELSAMLGEGEEIVHEALAQLESALAHRGIVLMRKDDMVALATHPEASELIESLSASEREKDLGKAGLETLALVLYHGPIGRADIDYVRGVNSAFILRSLSVRGLVERIANPNDKRSYLYRPTVELLSHLGVARLEDLPEFESIRTEIAAFREKADETRELGERS